MGCNCPNCTFSLICGHRNGPHRKTVTVIAHFSCNYGHSLSVRRLRPAISPRRPSNIAEHALLRMPYFARVAFAAVLNADLWRRNRGVATRQ